jgi:hypothetical protein
VHRIKGPGIKALKSPTKKKAGRLKPVINVKDLLKLEKQAEKALDAAQELKEEIENGRMSDAQTEK